MKNEKNENQNLNENNNHDYYAGMTAEEKRKMKEWEREYERGRIQAMNERYDHLI